MVCENYKGISISWQVNIWLYYRLQVLKMFHENEMTYVTCVYKLIQIFVLFVLMLYVPVKNFSVM